MTLLRRSEPPAERFPVETSSDTERLEAARLVLERIGTKRRRQLRVAQTSKLGLISGFFAFLLSGLLWKQSDIQIPIAWVVLNGAGFVLNSIYSWHKASRRQIDVLAVLTPIAEKQDLHWLIEGILYADTPEPRLVLLEKIKALLSTLEPADSAYLPEGARKILRSWIWSTFHPEPETALLVLQTLLRLEDPGTIKDCFRLARRKLDFPGDEWIQQLASRVTGIEARTTLTQANDLATALTVITERKTSERSTKIRNITLGSLAIVSLTAGFILLVQTGNALWLLPGAVIVGVTLCLAPTALIAREAFSYPYRCALLTLVKHGHTAEHRALLQEGLMSIGSGENYKALEQAIQRLEGSP